MVTIDLSNALNGFSRAVGQGKYKRISQESFCNLATASRGSPILKSFSAPVHNYLYFMLSGAPRYINLGSEQYSEFCKFLADNFSYYCHNVLDIKEYLKILEKGTIFPSQSIEEKENTMNIPSMNLDFGPAPSNYVRFSPYGMAIKSNDQWLMYDAKNGTTIDVTGMTFDFGNMIYKMPVAIKDVRPGDVIMHKGTAIFVAETAENKITGVDILHSEEKTVIPVTNIFGFNFVTKLTPLVNFNMGTPSPDQPFGNIMQMMLLSQIFGKEQNSDGDFFGEMSMEKLMMLSMLTGQQNPFANLMSAFTSTAASQETAQA